MPAIEIASFTASKGFLSDASVKAFNAALAALKENKGCLSVHHGFQLDDKTRGYVITVRDSYENHGGKTKLQDDNSVIKSEMSKAGLSLDDLSMHLFTIDTNPAPILEGPLPEIRLLRPKPAVADPEAQVRFMAAAFHARVANNECPGLTLDFWPLWLIGSNKEGSVLIVPVGWKGYEVRESFMKTGSYFTFMEALYEMSEVEITPLNLSRV